MNEPKPLRVRPKLYQQMKDEMPEVFTDTTTWGNYLIRVGLNFHLGLDPYGRLGKPTERRERNKAREVLPIPYIEENRINKEKNFLKENFDPDKAESKSWKFNKLSFSDQIPEELKPCEDLIVKFWKAKKGERSELAFNLLTGNYGLLGIQKKYGVKEVKEQLEEGTACKWASITLKKYEMYGRPQKADQEPVTNHPAGRLFKNGRFVDG